MRSLKLSLVAVLLLGSFSLTRATSSEETVAQLRARFAKIVEIDSQYYAAPEELRRDMPTGYREGLAVKKEPLYLLLEAIDQALRTGSLEERIGALGIYSDLIYEGKEKPNPAYYTLLLNSLLNDDLRSEFLTFALVDTLHWYPTRETVSAMTGVAERSTNFKLRETALARVADMMGLNLAVYANATPEQNEKAMSDFISWVAKNKDRIQFNKKGHFRLAGGEVREEREELGNQDRERIRRDPTGVLRLFNQIMGDDDDSQVDLTGECAVGLLGPEGAALMARRAAIAAEGKEPTREMEASLGSYQGSYPVADAALLAAVYIVAYEKDAGALKMAKGMLIQASRADVRRVAGSEPRSVRRKAEALAGGRMEEEED